MHCVVLKAHFEMNKHVILAYALRSTQSETQSSVAHAVHLFFVFQEAGMRFGINSAVSFIGEGALSQDANYPYDKQYLVRRSDQVS
jgi:hypothetical protein